MPRNGIISYGGYRRRFCYRIPFNPYGLKDLLSVRMDNVNSFLKRSSLITPSPPFFSPLPPVPLFKQNCFKITGYLQHS